MKKGFTLVELAIVLVVIGLLMGMAFKGKSLVDAARIKADVNKVQKLSTAINVYYSKYDTLPGKSQVIGGTPAVTYQDNSSGAIYQTLINEGLLKDSDFKASSGATYWVFIGCNHAANRWVPVGISEVTNLCIYRSSALPTSFTARPTPGGAEIGLTSASINGQTICQLETLLDDKNLTTGDGRLGTATALADGIVDTDNWNCANTGTGKGNNSINTATTPYLMRIF